ncbi:MAG: regulatory protein GemA [Candidatus Aminicenantes bacterium]|nr:regulatory protein GemA [Candidatus Aminicenantes bacterium]
MLINRKAKLSLIHVAKNVLKLSDETYQALLHGAAGVSSAREIEWEDQFQAIMNCFKKLGFKSYKALGKTTSRPKWPDTWGCSPDQRAKIEAMWQTCAQYKGTQSLHRFIKRIAGVDHPHFLRPSLARDVILALEKMMEKAGFDPVTGGRINL